MWTNECEEAIEKLKPFNLTPEQEDAILDMMLEHRTTAEQEGYEQGKAETLAKFQAYLIREGHRPWEQIEALEEKVRELTGRLENERGGS